MSQNSPTLLPSRETGASPSCLNNTINRAEILLSSFTMMIALVWEKCYHCCKSKEYCD